MFNKDFVKRSFAATSGSAIGYFLFDLLNNIYYVKQEFLDAVKAVRWERLIFISLVLGITIGFTGKAKGSKKG